MRPFIVTALQAGKLPRWALWLLCALYVIPGFPGRDPWRSDDATGFGLALTMARGGIDDWLMPNVAGEPVPGAGPLPYWITAIFARIGSPWSASALITEHAMVRLGTALLLTTTLILVWYASFALARRPGVQPRDPFGASARSTDFARAIADSVVLVLLATFGLLLRMHETTGDVAQVTWVALFMFGCAIALERPAIGGAIAGAAIAATLLSRGLSLALALTAVILLLAVVSRAYKLVAGRMLAAALLPALPGALAWPLALATGEPAARQHLLAWLGIQADSLSGPSLDNLTYLIETVPWFFWPAWPVAAWAAWRWRGRWNEPAVALPLLGLAAIGCHALIAPRGSESLLLPATVASAMLAGFGLPTLRRGLVSLIDWFSVISFSLFGVAVWAWWIALQTGFPPRMAYRASRIAPGFEPSWIIVNILAGLLATLAWIALVRWRIARHPPMIWRAMVLSSGGVVFSWFLLMTLWLPLFNERNAYREVALGLRTALADAPHDCVATDRLGPGQRASFLYFAAPVLGPRITPEQADAGGPPPGGCTWLLRQYDTRQSPAAPPAATGSTLVWEGRRRDGTGERFALYRYDNQNQYR
jgi:4-amino-4-deoxy-L-arabinose transferase-like glycosyltransferase